MAILENYLTTLTERNDAAIEIAGVAGDIGEKMSKMDFACRKQNCGSVMGVKASKRLCINQCKLKSSLWGLAKIRSAKSICNKAKTPLDKKLCLKEYNANIRGLETTIAREKQKIADLKAKGK